MEEDDGVRRRTLLGTLGASSMIPLAGCNTGGGSSADDPAGTGAATTGAGTATAADKQPPVVEQFDATPEQTGTVLDVSMTVSDNEALAWAEISVGTRTNSVPLDGTSAEIDERLTDVVDTSTSEPTRVRYRVRDAAGNETTGAVTPDTTAPSLTVEPRTAAEAGAVQLSVEGDDDVGLSELRVWLNDDEVHRASVSGQKAVSEEITVSTESADAATMGVRNRVSVALTDSLGNRRRKAVEQYVRKYDTMADPRLNLGGLYISQAGNALTYNLSEEVDTEPAVGMYDSPIPPEITSRHIDQMTGFGFTHVAYDYGDQQPWAEAFLKSDLAEQVEIMPTYIMPIFDRNMGKSWKDELLPRTLSFLKEGFLSRENAVTIDGRPVLDTWNWRVLAAHEEAQTDGRGVFAVDGEMVDAPLVAQAERIRERARAAGLDVD